MRTPRIVARLFSPDGKGFLSLGAVWQAVREVSAHNYRKRIPLLFSTTK